MNRPCERKCDDPPIGCGQWKHHSRFRSYRTNHGRYGTVSANGVSFGRICKDCEQKARNEKKNADRPRAIIEQRASVAASKVGATREFFMIQMNYRALIPELRALMSNEGLCKGCGHDFINERDIQIEHIEPIRFDKDWARLHARNIRLFCASCNGTKGHKPFGQWLDEQEGARLSNLQEPTPIRILAQMNLFN